MEIYSTRYKLIAGIDVKLCDLRAASWSASGKHIPHLTLYRNLLPMEIDSGIDDLPWAIADVFKRYSTEVCLKFSHVIIYETVSILIFYMHLIIILLKFKQFSPFKKLWPTTFSSSLCAALTGNHVEQRALPLVVWKQLIRLHSLQGKGRYKNLSCMSPIPRQCRVWRNQTLGGSLIAFWSKSSELTLRTFAILLQHIHLVWIG